MGELTMHGLPCITVTEAHPVFVGGNGGPRLVPPAAWMAPASDAQGQGNGQVGLQTL